VPETGSLIGVAAVAGAVTLALRAAPFAAMSALRSSPLVGYLGRHLPAGVMVILVIYLLRDVPWGEPLVGARELVAIAVVVGIQLWRRQALLSMAAGTVVYALPLADVVTRVLNH
jgi:branched-subunit amino acid transport protein AzlD